MTGEEIIATSYTRNSQKGLTRSQLVGRGWTHTCIARLLAPHSFQKNGHTLYPKKIALKLEKQKWWQLERRDHKRNTRIPTKNEVEFIETIMQLPIKIADVKNLYEIAKEYHFEQQRRSGQIPWSCDTINDNDVKRWAVNMLRHTCEGYDLFYQRKVQKLYTNSQFAIVKYKVLVEIERKYPVLQDECQRQKDMILKTYNYIGEYFDGKNK